MQSPAVICFKHRCELEMHDGEFVCPQCLRSFIPLQVSQLRPAPLVTAEQFQQELEDMLFKMYPEDGEHQ